MEPTPDEALLTAYLDDELTPQDRQHLEQRLANEPELRQRLTLLEETWHCLDLLEQESTDTEQIETTLKIAAISMSASSFVPLKISPFKKWGLAVFAGLALFAITFHLGKRSPLDDSSFRPMVERLDMYRAILDDDGLDLLRQLAVERVFLPPLPDDVPPIDPHEYQPNPHSSRTFHTFTYPVMNYRDEYNNTELYQLFYKNIQTFHNLSWEKREQVRKLHRDIKEAPRSVELVLTLQNYYYWLKSLQSYEKVKLKKPKLLEEKIEEIIALKTHLDRQQTDDSTLMPSEIIGIEESKHLAEALAKLTIEQQERLLNDEPFRIINELKQSFR